ncbi:MAG: hypothetical protein U0939_16180 [Pirellulales bacterium]
MTRFQRLVLSCFPHKWRRSVIRESRQWMLRCLTCGHRRSVWSVGGIRWKAYSKGKRMYVRCPQCQANHWAAVEYQSRERSSPN